MPEQQVTLVDYTVRPVQITGWRTVDHLRENAETLWLACQRGEANISEWRRAYVEWDRRQRARRRE